MEFSIKELVAKAHFDYVGPAFPQWWGQNKTKFVLPSLMGIGSEILLGRQYFQTLKVSYNGEQFVFPNEPLISLGLTKTIVEICQNLKLESICEGVEKEEHASFLRDIGCRKLQGYYFSKPVPFEPEKEEKPEEPEDKKQDE